MAWVLCLAAWLLIVGVDVESVLGTGPAIFATGLVLVIFGLRARFYHAVWVGVAHMAICAHFVAMVNLFHWSPGSAREPFIRMGLIFVIGSLPWIVWVWAHAPPTRHAWQCVKCGYLLYGLSEPRCPECGTPFDPDQFAEGERERR